LLDPEAEKASTERKSMPEKRTAAGEFVKEEMDHIRSCKHGAKSAKQAVAIGLSKARRAGIPLPNRRGKKAARKRTHAPAPRRSRAVSGVLKRQPRRSASHRALSRQAHQAARRRGRADRRRAGRRAAATRRR
jgi:hypothetical protein